MSYTLTIPFTDEDDHVLGAGAEISDAGKGQLALQQADVDFTEDFADDTDHTYDSDESEFVGGQVEQKDQRSTGYTLYDDFSDSSNANWGIGTLTRNLQSAIVADGLLDCTGGTPKRAYYNSDNLTNLDDGIVIDILFRPDFNSAPGEITYLAHIFQSTVNSIQIYLNVTGSIIIRALDAAGGYAINRTISKSDWIQDQEYRLTLFLNSGDSRAYLDESLKFTDSNTWNRDTGNPLLYVGSNSSFSANSHFKFDSIYIGTNVDYVTDAVYSSTMYVETSDILPEMAHTGDGTIKLFNSLSMTYSGAPRILLEIGRSGNKLYWDGASWAISDETYAQATDLVTYNANCTSLPVDGEEYGQFTIVFPDSNSQSAVSSLTADMNVDNGYLTTNPTIEPNASFRTDNITSLAATYTATGSDTVNCILKKNGTWYYWDGAAWVASDGTYAQSVSLADCISNIGALADQSTVVKIKIFLHSADGTTTPTISNLTFTYSYGGETPDTIDTCIVWGWARDFQGVADTTDFTVALNLDVVQYKDSTTIRSNSVTVTPDASGYWEVVLTETENMVARDGATIKYVFDFGNGLVFEKSVPNESAINYNDL